MHKIKFIWTHQEIKVNGRKNQTYIPVGDPAELILDNLVVEPNIQTPNPNQNYIDFEIDINGFQLDQVFLDEIPERRNGLPSHAHTFGYNGNMHVFPLYNDDWDDVTIMLRLNQMMVAPYTYILPYTDGIGYGQQAPLYTKATEILRVINQNTLYWGGWPVAPNYPSAIRVCFQDITTTHNNGIGANKEFDLSFSVYGVWNKDGLLPMYQMLEHP